VNNFSVIIVVFIIFLFGAIALKLTLEISKNVKIAENFRKQLLARLEKLPIINMLGKRNIDINKYLYSVPIIDIEKQLHNCDECSAKKECKDLLEKETEVEADYSFCANDDEFGNLNDK